MAVPGLKAGYWGTWRCPKPVHALSALLSGGMQSGSQVATIRDITVVTREAEDAVGAWRMHPTPLEGQAVDTR